MNAHRPEPGHNVGVADARLQPHHPGAGAQSEEFFFVAGDVFAAAEDVDDVDVVDVAVEVVEAGDEGATESLGADEAWIHRENRMAMAVQPGRHGVGGAAGLDVTADDGDDQGSTQERFNVVWPAQGLSGCHSESVALWMWGCQ